MFTSQLKTAINQKNVEIRKSLRVGKHKTKKWNI